MKPGDIAQFGKVAGACADWLVRRNQSPDGSFKDSRRIGCIFEMGQAIVALLQYGAAEHNPAAVDSAVRCGDWILARQARSRDRRVDGLWVTPEYGRGLIVVPDTIESLRGMLELYRHTGRKEYLASARRAFAAVRRAVPRLSGRWVSGGGIRSRVYMHYDLRAKRYAGGLHRAIDDGIWYQFHRLTGDPALLAEFKTQCDEQMKYQTADGGFYETYFSPHTNAIMVAGARWSVYWAAWPFFYAYEAFQDRRYLEVVERSCNWLADRQERDGSFYAWYYANGDVAYDRLDPNSPSAALILWCRYMRLTGSRKYLAPCERALAWLIRTGRDVAPPASRGRVGSAERVGLFNTRATAFAIRAYYELKDLNA